MGNYNFQISEAVKVLKPLKVLSYGATYSGKTLGSLLMANGLVQAKLGCSEAEAWDHIVLVDTEQGRGALYAGMTKEKDPKAKAYKYIKLDAPYTTEKLDALIDYVNGLPDIEVVILDSLTHFWTKSGGLLEQKSLLDSAPGANSYVNWDKVGSKLNKTIDKLLASPKDFFVTLRAKSDTVLMLDDKGKTVPKTFGLKPEFREGFTFEFDIVFNIDKDDHSLLLEKAIPGMEMKYDPATIDFGKLIYQFHSSNATSPIRTVDDVRKTIRDIAKTRQDLIMFVQTNLNGRELNTMSMDECIELEKKLIAYYRKNQKK